MYQYSFIIYFHINIFYHSACIVYHQKEKKWIQFNMNWPMEKRKKWIIILIDDHRWWFYFLGSVIQLYDWNKEVKDESGHRGYISLISIKIMQLDCQHSINLTAFFLSVLLMKMPSPTPLYFIPSQSCNNFASRK